jgi:hypothetical protein
MQDRFRWAVAILRISQNMCTLRYLASGIEFESLNQGRSFDRAEALGYQGYPAFNPRRLEHNSGVLEALMRRLPPRSRPDYNDYRRQFRIAADATPSDFALLGATEAKLPSDGFSVVDPLDPEALNCDLMLEVAGFRYYADKLTNPLEIGCPVELLHEPQNEKDPGAVEIRARDKRIGYVNRLQAPTFLKWLAKGHVSATLERLNGSRNHPRAFIFVRVRAAEKNKKAA